VSTQNEDDRQVPGSGKPELDVPQPAVTDADWKDTERWLDEWSRRVSEADDPGPEDGRSADPPEPAPADPALADDDARRGPPRAAANSWPAGYVPPPSPAYAAGKRPHVPFARSGPPPRPVVPPTPPATSPPPTPPTPPTPPSRSPDAAPGTAPRWRGQVRAGHLLSAVLAVAVVALASAALLARGDDGGPETVELGQVAAVDAGTTVRSGARTRPLSAGDAVAAGDVVQAPRDGSVPIDLDGGGVVRVDTGASLTFIDDAIDPETGELDGDSEPVLEILAGRAWVNPSDDIPLEVRLPGGRATTAANPLAIECPGDCTLHAPAAGVAIDTASGGDAAPAPTEVVTLRADGTMSLATASPETPWARQNLDADRAAGQPEPELGDEPGVVASAVLDGVHPVRIEIVGAPGGDPLPDALVYGPGETYTLELQADGRACPPTSCQVPVTAPDGASGTAEVGGGTIAVTFSQQIDCFDETRSNVVVAGIGTTTVTGTLQVGAVVQDGTRWRVTASAGTGTVSTTLTTPCNTGDVLGTSTSPTAMTLG
jgi:hypothetical protein